MKFLLAILAFILLIPVMCVAAMLLLGAGVGFITEVFVKELLIIAGIILVFVVLKLIFRKR